MGITKEIRDRRKAVDRMRKQLQEAEFGLMDLYQGIETINPSSCSIKSLRIYSCAAFVTANGHSDWEGSIHLVLNTVAGMYTVGMGYDEEYDGTESAFKEEIKEEHWDMVKEEIYKALPNHKNNPESVLFGWMK